METFVLRWTKDNLPFWQGVDDGEKIEINAVADVINENAKLKRENKRLLDGIHNARHCLTHGRNTTPTEGERFDIGTTYTKLSMMLGEPWSTLLTKETNDED